MTHILKIKYKPNGTGRHRCELPSYVDRVRDVRFKSIWYKNLIHRCGWLISYIDYHLLNWNWKYSAYYDTYQKLNRVIDYCHKNLDEDYSYTTNSYNLASEAPVMLNGLLYDVVKTSFLARSGYIYIYYDSKIKDRDNKLKRLGI